MLELNFLKRFTSQMFTGRCITIHSKHYKQQTSRFQTLKYNLKYFHPSTCTIHDEFDSPTLSQSSCKDSHHCCALLLEIPTFQWCLETPFRIHTYQDQPSNAPWRNLAFFKDVQSVMLTYFRVFSRLSMLTRRLVKDLHPSRSKYSRAVHSPMNSGNFFKDVHPLRFSFLRDVKFLMVPGN